MLATYDASGDDTSGPSGVGAAHGNDARAYEHGWRARDGDHSDGADSGGYARLALNGDLDAAGDLDGTYHPQTRAFGQSTKDGTASLLRIQIGGNSKCHG
jgi:hypothetical protein